MTVVRPDDGDLAGVIVLSEAEDDARVAGRGVAAATVHVACLRALRGVQDDSAADDVAMVGTLEVDADPVVFGWADVAEDYDGLVNVADDQVDAAVVIEIAASQAACIVFLLEIRSALFGARSE